MRHQNIIVKTSLLVWYSISWTWIFQTNAVRMTGIESQSLMLKSIIYTVNVLLSVIISYVFITQSINYIKSKRSINWTLSAIISATLLPILALMHFLIAWIPALAWIGPQGSIDNILPFSAPAIFLIETPLSYGFRILGFFGLSAILSLIFCIIIAKKYKSIITHLLLILTSSAIGWAAWKTPSSTNSINVVIMSEHLDSRNEPIRTEGTDLVLFPEYGLNKITESNINNRLEISADSSSYYIGSEQVRSDDVGFYNRMILGNTKAGVISKQDKRRMIPAGEDLPFALHGLLRVANRQDIIRYFNHAKYTIRGSHMPQNLQLGDGRVIGAALCSSIISPEDYRDMTMSGATILTNSASLTTFNGSRLFGYQQKAMAKFMAVANARPFLQSANTGPAFAIDINGKTIAELQGISNTTVTTQPNSHKTLYTILGEWLVKIGIALLAYKAIQRGISRSRHHNNQE